MFIEHDDEGPEKALEEFYRVLVPVGIAIITVPGDNNLSRRCSRILHEEGNNLTFFQYSMTEDELRTFTEKAGFEILDCGSEGNITLAFLFPGLYKKLDQRMISLINKAVNILFFWEKGAAGIIYCMARKLK